MAPKKESGAAPKKAAAAPTHAPYKDMIKTAIVNLKDRMGSSRQAIKKYVKANNNLGATTDAAFDKHINAALSAGEKSGEFERPKGPSGPTKLAKKGDAKPAAASKAKKPAAAKPATAKKEKPAPKKASTTATTTTTKKEKAPATKIATKTKANSAKPRKTVTKKTPSTAPAIDEKKPVVLGKTKSGRVTKGTAPTPSKKAAPKKTAAKKAAPKKSTTPKKAEPSPKKAEASA